MRDAARGTRRRRWSLLAGAVGLLAGPLAAAADEPMRIVGVPSLQQPMRVVADRLVKANLMAPPEMQFGKTTDAVAAFCRSWRKDTPSVLALSRRLRIHEAEVCALYGVSEIVEIQLGYQALVLVTVRSDADLDLRLQDLRAAIAKEIPGGEGFVPNPHRTWRDVNAKLPDMAIRLALPAADADSRTFFEERFLVAACRRIPKIRAIFDAVERTKKCITLRDDGVVVDLPELHGPAVRAALEAAPKGTVSILPMAVAGELATVVKLLPIDGVPPSPTTIAARAYPFIQPLYVYVKRLHIKDYLGRGAVHGLRELITELTREDTIGPDGYLVPEGLVPMLETRRAAIRDRALRLESMER